MHKFLGRQLDDKHPQVVEARQNLQGMEEAFKYTGDLSMWSPDLLQEIDAAFVKHYLDKEGNPLPFLFFPNSPENMNAFTDYSTEVILALRMHSQTAPPYAREYFQYYCIWQMRGWKFPVPLGTASVISALMKTLHQVKEGFSEVSAMYGRARADMQLTMSGKVVAWIATSVSWSTKINAKVFVSRDQFDAMVDCANNDLLVKGTTFAGLRRKVSASGITWWTAC